MPMNEIMKRGYEGKIFYNMSATIILKQCINYELTYQFWLLFVDKRQRVRVIFWMRNLAMLPLVRNRCQILYCTKYTLL